MSSDTYRISVTPLGPTTLSLTCETTTAIGPNDLATTRSFVLLALYLALPASAPLAVALEALGIRAGLVEESFYREHVGTFVAWTRLLRRENLVSDVAARSRLLAELSAREASGEAPPGFDVLEELWKQYPPHRFVLEVRMTEARWLEGVPSFFATTAYDVWESDRTPAGAPDLVRSPWTTGALRGFEVSGAELADLAVSADGRRIFARVSHTVDRSRAGAPGCWLAALGPGAVVTLDAETLAEEGRLELAPLLARDFRGSESVSFTRVSPRGDAVWVVDRGAAGFYLLEPERLGERADVAHCTSAGFFSDVAFEAELGDSALVSNGQEVETRHAHTEWPGVHATHAVMDYQRIAAVGPRELAVYDRRAEAERFRVAVGKSWQVALLPGGRTAVICGQYMSAQLRIFDAEGRMIGVFRVRGASGLKASPAGLLAVRLGEIVHVIDVDTVRAVVVSEEPLGEVAWLDDARLAVLRGDARGLAILDVRAALAGGRVVKLEKPAAKKPSAKKARIEEPEDEG